MSEKVCFKHLKHARSWARTVTSLGRKIIHCWERIENTAVRAEQNVCVCVCLCVCEREREERERKVTLD